MSRHRVSLRRPSLRRYPDPVRSRDPQVRTVVDQLGKLPLAPGPDPAFRAELRAQLVAITPRMVAEGAEQIAREAAVATEHAIAGEAADDAPIATRARHAREVAGKTESARTVKIERGPRVGHALKIASATLTVLVLLLGGAVWVSRSALPGDTLYGLKRASESVQLATSSSGTDRAQDYLQFAQTRAAEVKALLAQSHTGALGSKPGASGAVDAHTSSLIQSTLKSSDSDVRSAASLLGRAALQQHSDSPLKTMTSWAPEQLSRLRAIWTSMPLGALRTRAASSRSLVEAAQHRASALHNLVTCVCMSGAGSDQLGPVPCTQCASRPATTSPQPGSGHNTRTGSARNGSSGNGSNSGSSGATGHAKPGTATSGSATSGAAGGSNGGGGGSSPRLPLPTTNLPGLPLPSSPVQPKASVGSCAISVSVIGIQVSVGACPSQHR